MFNIINKMQAEKTTHAEFWHFVGYASATAVLLKQGWIAQTNWAFVSLFVSYLAIVAASTTAVKIIAMLKHGDSP